MVVNSSLESVERIPPPKSMPPLPNQTTLPMNLACDQSSSEMISLGLEEPLPMQEAIDELWAFAYGLLSMNRLIELQAWDIFWSDTRRCTDDSQISVSRRHEFGADNAPSGLPSLCHVGHRGLGQRQVL